MILILFRAHIHPIHRYPSGSTRSLVAQFSSASIRTANAIYGPGTTHDLKWTNNANGTHLHLPSKWHLVEWTGQQAPPIPTTRPLCLRWNDFREGGPLAADGQSCECLMHLWCRWAWIFQEADLPASGTLEHWTALPTTLRTKQKFKIRLQIGLIWIHFIQIDSFLKALQNRLSVRDDRMKRSAGNSRYVTAWVASWSVSETWDVNLRPNGSFNRVEFRKLLIDCFMGYLMNFVSIFYVN